MARKRMYFERAPKRKRPAPRPLSPVEEDGSYSTVGAWVRDAESKKLRRPIKWRS